MPHSVNLHPVTVTRTADAVVVTGRLDTDADLSTTSGETFTVAVRSKMDGERLLDCLRAPGFEVPQDWSRFGVMRIGDGLPVEPTMMCRHLLAWTGTAPTAVEAVVCWMGWTGGNCADFCVTLNLDAASRLYSEVAGSLEGLPEVADEGQYAVLLDPWSTA